MHLRRTVGLATIALMVGLLTLVGSQASSSASASQYKRPVALVASTTELVEGDRLKLTATIANPRKAKRVTLERWNVPLYYGTPSWQTVKSVKVRNRKRVTFKYVATALNSERFRAVVTYKSAKPARSKTIGVKVWRWIPLSDYRPYYDTNHLIFSDVTINGRRYKGYGPPSYSRARSWEARFTPGRNCRAFRGVAGLADISGDGSSGSVTITADDAVTYESPALTPGMDSPFEISLELPYRLGLQFLNTSPEKVDSWPVIGEPALLCTGV